MLQGLRVWETPSTDPYLILPLDEVERPQYIASVMRSLFANHSGSLEIVKHIPNLPNYQAPSFTSELVTFASSEEWLAYKDGMVSAYYIIIITIHF